MARDFDGTTTTDQIDIGRNTALEGAAAMSVAAWVRWEGSAPTFSKTISRKQSTGLTYAFGIGWDGAHNKARFWPNTGLFGNTGDGSTDCSDGNWHHICGTWDGTTALIYVDGVQENSASISGSLGVDTDSVIIGRWQNGGPDHAKECWDGLIAEHAIWTAGLTADEVAALARGVSPRRIRSPLSYHPLWGLDTIEPDLTGNSNHGTLSGTTRGNHAPVSPFSGMLWNVGYLPAAGVGDVSVTPSAAAARAAAISPAVQLGSLSQTPATAIVRALALAPTVQLGSLSLLPAIAAARFLAVAPTIASGSVSFTPAAASGRTAAIGPTIGLGSLALTPTPAIARLLAEPPTIRLGSLAITPTPAISRALAVAPSVTSGSPANVLPSVFHPLLGGDQHPDPAARAGRRSGGSARRPMIFSNEQLTLTRVVGNLEPIGFTLQDSLQAICGFRRV